MEDFEKLDDRELLARAARLEQEQRHTERELDAVRTEIRARGLAFVEDWDSKSVRLYTSDEDMAAQKTYNAQQPNDTKIRVTFFGTFHAFFTEDGKELTWRTKKGSELFAYLLHMRGAAVERKTLLRELWQEDIPNSAVAMLHNMLYNLRKELANYNLDQIIQYRNKKYMMDTSVIESDIDVIQEAAKYVERGKADRLIEKRALFDTYWGRYLEDMDSKWIEEEQEYFERIYERGCIMIAACLMENGSFDEAVRYLKNALLVNNYSEAAMKQLLECYKGMGDFNSIKRQYSEFCRTLEDELGISPGNELEKIYGLCMGKIAK